VKRKKIDFSRWHRKGSSTLEYVIVMAAAILLAGVLYSVMSSNDVAGIIKEKVMQALNGQSTGVNVAGGSPSNEPAPKQPKPSHPNKPTHPAPPPDNNSSNPFVEGLKTAGHVTLDFIGYYDAKAALTGVDENGNKIGWGERLVRGAMVLPIGKPVKGVKMAAKYGDDVLRYGKGYVDNFARKSKKVACGCPRFNWEKMSSQLREAAKGKGNFNIGSATRAEANAMGEAWVGEGYKIASDGKTLVSKDGMRQYRPPTYKPKLKKYQANFEQRVPGQKSKRWQSNAHLDIID